jgi:hypothetical protein
MATLRSEFLTTHPATALWWQQRAQCERCAHVRVKMEAFERAMPVMRCAVVRTPAGRQELAYCIDARAGACGPDAQLFKEM